MARRPRFAFPSRGTRSLRLLERRQVRDQLVSVAGLVGRAARLGDGREVGRVVDAVAVWSGEPYPLVTGVVLRVGHRRAFVPATDLAALDATGVTLSSPRLDVRDFAARTGEVQLMADVVDHQLVDTDGVQVVRAADLYVARVGGAWRLVGVETGALSLLRRLGPRRWRVRATPERVIDWADVQPVGRPGAVRLDRPTAELRRLRPGDVADLLEALGSPQRHELLGVLDADLAADALEEMDDADRDRLLRHLEPQRAAAIVAEMEPDEAADALRRMAPGERAALLAASPPERRRAVETVLGYGADTAGGIMTTIIALAAESEFVSTVLDGLHRFDAHRADVDGVLVVGPDGRLLDDVSLFELAVSSRDQPIKALVGPPWPIVVTPDAPLDDVLDAVLSNRRGSIVVVDEGGRPLGRILADDVLDAFAPRWSSVHRDVGNA
jgi:CBS domain-containing protein